MAGRSIAARMAIIAITTSNSINVKALWRAEFIPWHGPLPVGHGTIICIIRFRVAPVMINLVRQPFFVQFDAKARSGGNIDIAVTHGERLFEIAFAEADMFLAQEVWDGSGE